MAETYGKGYLYVDKSGIPHVVEDLETAKKYTGGKVYEYYGKYGGGYALKSGERATFPNLPGVDKEATRYWKRLYIPFIEVK